MPALLAVKLSTSSAARPACSRHSRRTIPSDAASPVIHIYAKPAPSSLLAIPLPVTPSSASSLSSKHGHSNPTSVLSAREPQHAAAEHAMEERLLQELLEEALAQGVLVTRAKRLTGQEMIEPRPSIRLALSSALSRKDTEKAVAILKSVLVKVLRNRK